MDILEISKLAKEKLNITSLRPFQELIVFSILENIEKNRKTPILSILPTGGGKSLCFTLPALLVKGITIIVYPIKALMHDQEKQFTKFNIASVLLEGGMSKEEVANLFLSLKTKKAKILITNIEMLTNWKILEQLRLLPISLFVVDEVHTVITWGESFRPSYLKIGYIANFLNAKQLLAFTATTNNYINQRLKEVLFLGKDYHIIQGGSNRSNLIFHVRKAFSLRAEIFTILQDKALLPSIVFVPTRQLASSLADEFSSYFETKAYHAGLEKAEKKEIEDWFYNSEDGLLFATCAYGMGVNKSNIRSVIHYALPAEEAMYLQESGRGGRDGKTSHSFALIKASDKSSIKHHFDLSKCIRASLIQALEQNYGESCTGCSYCLNEKCNNYAFMEELIKRIKHHPFLYSYNKAYNQLCTKKKKVLPFYYKGEVKDLLDYLIKTKRIHRFLNRLC